MTHFDQGSVNRDTTADLSCFRSNGEVLLFGLQRDTGGQQLAVLQAERICVNCNRSFNSSLEVCPFCGANQRFVAPSSTTTSQKSAKSRSTAAILAILLGIFGIHKFYLGQTTWGVLYLLFCWTYIPGVIGFFEGLILLFMKDEQFAQKYG